MSRRKLPSELRLSRRTLLRGALGGGVAALALPTLEAMLNTHGDALANGDALPRRLVCWMWGNGCRLEHWLPTQTGPGFTLTPELEPLAGVMDYCTVLSGFQNKVAGRRGHHDGMAAFMSGYPFIQIDAMGAPYASKFGGPSFDQLVADVIGQDTFIKSLQLGVTKRFEANQGPTLATMSHRGPDQPLGMERDPAKVYDRLFMSFAPVDDPDAGLRTRAFDAVLEDAQRLKKRVSTQDQARIDAHLEGVFEVQKKLLVIPPSCGDLPAKPDVDLYFEDGAEPLEAINDVMAQMVALAFACDLTRVVTYMFTGASGGQQFYMLPPTAFPEHPGGKDYSHADHHQTSHINLAYEQDFIHKSTVVTMENFAVFLEHLRQTPDATGMGNLLDHSAVLAFSDVAEGWAHSEIDHPIVVAGRAGGRLKSGVGHHRTESLDNVTDISLACAHAVLPEPTVLPSLGGPTEGTSYDGFTDTPCAAIYEPA